MTFLQCWLQSRVGDPCQGALQENLAKGKIAAAARWCWTYYSWMKEVNHLSMESNSLTSEYWDGFINFLICRIKSLQNWDEQRYSMWNQIWQRPDCFVCFFLPENMSDGCLFDQFYEVSMLVLLPVAIWGVCHFMWFVFCLALWLWMCRSWWCVGM